MYLINKKKCFLIPFEELPGWLVKKFDAMTKNEQTGNEVVITFLVKPEEIIPLVLRAEKGELPGDLCDHISPKQQLEILADLIISRQDFLADGGTYFETLLQQKLELRKNTAASTPLKATSNPTPARKTI